MHQHGIACGMAEGVVDLLEAVEIDMEERKAAAVAMTGPGALLEGLVEIAAIGQIGQRVVERGVFDARRCRDQFGVASIGQSFGALEVAPDVHVGGHVPIDADDPRRAVGLAIAGANGPDRANGAVLEAQPVLGPVGTAGAHGIAEIPLGPRKVVGMKRSFPVRVVSRLAILGTAVELVHPVIPDQIVGEDVVLPDTDLRSVECEAEAARHDIELVLALAERTNMLLAFVDEVAGYQQRDQHQCAGKSDHHAEPEGIGQRRLPSSGGTTGNLPGARRQLDARGDRRIVEDAFVAEKQRSARARTIDAADDEIDIEA